MGRREDKASKLDMPDHSDSDREDGEEVEDEVEVEVEVERGHGARDHSHRNGGNGRGRARTARKVDDDDDDNDDDDQDDDEESSGEDSDSSDDEVCAVCLKHGTLVFCDGKVGGEACDLSVHIKVSPLLISTRTLNSYSKSATSRELSYQKVGIFALASFVFLSSCSFYRRFLICVYISMKETGSVMCAPRI